MGIVKPIPRYWWISKIRLSLFPEGLVTFTNKGPASYGKLPAAEYVEPGNNRKLLGATARIAFTTAWTVFTHCRFKAIVQ